jgi:hypothetical protein
MKVHALRALFLAGCAIACSGTPSGHTSVLERARTACAGVILPLPEGSIAPALIHSVKPDPGPRAPYPSATACLEIQVEADGSVTFVRTISTTNPAFANTFRQAVLLWRYKPAQLNGTEISVHLVVSAAFEHH